MTWKEYHTHENVLAIQWKPEMDAEDFPNYIGGKEAEGTTGVIGVDESGCLIVLTSNGAEIAEPYDWLVVGKEMKVVEDGLFKMMYEEVG